VWALSLALPNSKPKSLKSNGPFRASATSRPEVAVWVAPVQLCEVPELPAHLPPKKRTRKPMTAAQKKVVGDRMRKYWAERRKAK
jgi:hypothetical protein